MVTENEAPVESTNAKVKGTSVKSAKLQTTRPRSTWN